MPCRKASSQRWGRFRRVLARSTCGRSNTSTHGGKGAEAKDGQPGWQSDGAYLTPEGLRLRKDFELAMYLRTVQDWIIRPQLKTVAGVAEVDAIGGYEQQFQVQPDPHKLLSLGLSFGDVIKAIERNNAGIGAGYIERRGEVLCRAR